MPTITARSLKVTVVCDAASLLALQLPEGQPRVVINIRLPDRSVSADLNAKSVRKALATLREHGADACAAIVQGRLTAGDKIADAGLAVQVKAPKEAAQSVGTQCVVDKLRQASMKSGHRCPEWPRLGWRRLRLSTNASMRSGHRCPEWLCISAMFNVPPDTSLQ